MKYHRLNINLERPVVKAGQEATDAGEEELFRKTGRQKLENKLNGIRIRIRVSSSRIRRAKASQYMLEMQL